VESITKSNDGLFYAGIYISGFEEFKGEKIENAFLRVYKAEFKNQLKESLTKFIGNNEDVQNYKFIFVGHSFGGSLAVLAAFDMLTENVIKANPEINSPLVYSYGQLRIGDDHFVNTVNSKFKIIRIVKNSDFFPRLPNCVYSPQLKKWRCFRDTFSLYLRFPEYRRYIMQYAGKESFNEFTTGIQTAYEHTNNLKQSFLERISRTLRSKSKARAKSKAKGYYYSTNNPGYKVYSYGSSLENQGSKSYGGVYYSQPMGAEVLYSERFNRFQVCSYFKGIPTCERQLPKSFKAGPHSKYYGENVEDC